MNGVHIETNPKETRAGNYTVQFVRVLGAPYQGMQHKMRNMIVKNLRVSFSAVQKDNISVTIMHTLYRTKVSFHHAF